MDSDVLIYDTGVVTGGTGKLMGLRFDKLFRFVYPELGSERLKMKGY